MRLATIADAPALEPIAIADLKVAYPGVQFGEHLGGFAEQLTRPNVLVSVTDTLDAFLLSERMEDGRWFVRFLMPMTMAAQTGKDLISFAMLAEHAIRPLLATTECYARLNEQSAVERATRDAYKIVLGCPARTLTAPDGTAIATEIYMAASDLAKKLRVRL